MRTFNELVEQAGELVYEIAIKEKTKDEDATALREKLKELCRAIREVTL